MTATVTRRTRARPEFHQLDVFLKVVEAGSFAGAAREMGRTQPAISQAIARLEEIYGGDLFQRRRGARLALTPVGEAILPSARILLYTVDQQMARAVAAAQGHSGALTIGLGVGLGSSPLSRGLAEFASAHPAVRLHYVEGHRLELERMLEDRSVDMIFAAAAAQSSEASLTRECLWQEALVVVLREDHPLASRLSLTWSDVGRLQLLMRENDDLAALVPTLSNDAPLNGVRHDVSNGVLHDMIAIGLGETIALASIKTLPPGLVARPICGADITVPIEAVWPKNDGNPIRHKLLNYVRRQARAASEPDRPQVSRDRCAASGAAPG